MRRRCCLGESMQTFGGQVIVPLSQWRKTWRGNAWIPYGSGYSGHHVFAVCCAVAFVRIYLYIYIYIYAAIFSCQAECFFVLSVSILDLFAGRSCPRQHYSIETRTVSSKECQSNPYIYVLFVSIRTLLACRSLSPYSGSVRWSTLLARDVNMISSHSDIYGEANHDQCSWCNTSHQGWRITLFVSFGVSAGMVVLQRWRPRHFRMSVETNSFPPALWALCWPMSNTILTSWSRAWPGGALNANGWLN